MKARTTREKMKDGEKRDNGTSATGNLAWDITDSLAEITLHQKYLLWNCSLFLMKKYFS